MDKEEAKQYCYDNIEKPFKNHKREVWYDDSKEVNRLDELAQLLGLRKIMLYGEKDDEADIAIIKTNNAGDGLILENCHIKLVLNDNVDKYCVKDSEGNKTFFDRGDTNVI